MLADVVRNGTMLRPCEWARWELNPRFLCLAKIAGALGHVEAKTEEFAVDAGGAPQSGLAIAIVRTNERSSESMPGRPPRRRDRRVHYCLNPSRNQRMTVSG